MRRFKRMPPEIEFCLGLELLLQPQNSRGAAASVRFIPFLVGQTEHTDDSSSIVLSAVQPGMIDSSCHANSDNQLDLSDNYQAYVCPYLAQRQHR